MKKKINNYLKWVERHVGAICTSRPKKPIIIIAAILLPTIFLSFIFVPIELIQEFIKSFKEMNEIEKWLNIITLALIVLIPIIIYSFYNTYKIKSKLNSLDMQLNRFFCAFERRFEIDYDRAENRGEFLAEDILKRIKSEDEFRKEVDEKIKI